MQTIDMNFRNFKQVDGDIDFKTGIRILSGRITKARYKKLDRYARRATQRFHCGHEWDCCGCLCGRRISLEPIHNGIKLILTESYNY